MKKINNIQNELVVLSKTENLYLIREFVETSARNAGLKQEEIDKIILSVDEAATNVIKHAYKTIGIGEIIINTETKDNSFSVIITDFGNSFDAEAVKSPDMEDYLRKRKVGGLGVYLIRTLMDDVNYESVPGKYNRVKMTKKILNN